MKRTCFKGDIIINESIVVDIGLRRNAEDPSKKTKKLEMKKKKNNI